MIRIVRRVGMLSLLLALALPTAALATTGTGHQNPNLAVSASLSPNTASNGDVVTATETVTNTSSATRTVTLRFTLTAPGNQIFSRSGQVVLKPGTTSNQTQTCTVDATYPRGAYTLRVDATNGKSTSSATATTTVV